MKLTGKFSKYIGKFGHVITSLCQGLLPHVPPQRPWERGWDHAAKNARVAASLLSIFEPISGCVRIASSGLMTTSRLQVVNRLDASPGSSFSRRLQEVFQRFAASLQRSSCIFNLLSTSFQRLRVVDRPNISTYRNE